MLVETGKIKLVELIKFDDKMIILSKWKFLTT